MTKVLYHLSKVSACNSDAHTIEARREKHRSTGVSSLINPALRSVMVLREHVPHLGSPRRGCLRAQPQWYCPSCTLRRLAVCASNGSRAMLEYSRVHCLPQINLTEIRKWLSRVRLQWSGSETNTLGKCRTPIRQFLKHGQLTNVRHNMRPWGQYAYARLQS